VSADAIYLTTIWAIPVIVAITFHEAAHGFVAHLLGDDTAWRLGRVSFNPLKHVDPFGRRVACPRSFRIGGGRRGRKARASGSANARPRWR
jgi:Zn-dependent protease